MSVTFSSGGSSAEIQNPLLGDQFGVRTHDVRGLSADGSRRRLSKGDVRRVLSLKFEGLRDAEKEDLEDFFDDVVNGAESAFTYTDHNGDAWTARFLSTELRFTEVDDGVSAAGTFGVGGTSYPTTTRTAPVWGVEIELEVTAA